MSEQPELIVVDEYTGVQIERTGYSIRLAPWRDDTDGLEFSSRFYDRGVTISAAGALKLSAYIEAHRAELQEAADDEARYLLAGMEARYLASTKAQEESGE